MGALRKILNRFSFRRKLFFSYLSVMLICCIMSGVQIYFAINNELKSQRQQILSGFMLEVASHFEQTMEACQKSILSVLGERKVSATLHYVSDSYYQQYEDLNQTLLPAVTLVQLQVPELRALTIYSGNHMLDHLNKAIQPLGTMDEGLRSRQPDGESFYWTVDGGCVTAVYRLMKPSQAVADNYVVGMLDTGILMQAGEGRIYEGDFILTGPNGEVLMPLIRSSFAEGLQERIAVDPEIQEVRSDTGRTYLVDSQQLSCGWQLSLLFPKDLLEVSPNLQIATAIISTLLVGMLLLLVLTRLFSGMFSRRIVGLNNAAREVGRGNFDVHLEVQGQDEIGQLMGQFQKMAVRLNRLMQDVRQSEARRLEAELRALRAQIKPHFLYNTLSMINWMALRSGSEDISMVATNISDYYRTMLNDGKDEILLMDELVNVKAYLAIQLMSHENSFTVAYDIPQELEKRSLINMLLQPIVENAVRHGVDQRPEGGGEVRISARQEGETLILSVQDDGPGMDEAAIGRILREDKGGYGLKNVQERIQFHAGEAYGLRIKSQLGKGATVEVHLPASGAQPRIAGAID